MADNALSKTLSTRGFTVLQKLAGTGTCSIFSLVANDASGSADGLLAAKVVKLAGLDARGRVSALQEVSFLKGMAPHPNLMAYRDSFLDDTQLIIVMSLAEDGDLRSVVHESSARKRAIPDLVVVSWIRQTLAGLSHMHSLAVLHRDLKSSNVFLSEGRRRLRIGDFGISKMLESASFAESCVGTPAYMSPEIMKGEPYDYKSDMWAVGVICYELATLQMPFPATTFLDLFVQVTETEPDWDRWMGFPQELCDITRQLLLKDGISRPSAACILKGELFLNDPDVTDEMWAVVATGTMSDSLEKMDSKGAFQKTSSSQASTAIGSDASQCPSVMVIDQPLNLSLEDFEIMRSASEQLQGSSKVADASTAGSVPAEPV
jgi:NIMA (never in mitosis gene a)-related kinase